MIPSYPKRLIEVDLPIKRISAHARDEKDSRLAHIPRLHIYPAARPLAACRAIICAALWPDPGGKHCPELFRAKARHEMTRWSRKHLSLLSADSFQRFNKEAQKKVPFEDAGILRAALLDFIADFSNWDNSTTPEYLETSRVLTEAAHESLGGMQGSKPLIIDPFSGGGAISLEALRVGCDVFASDLNPVAVLINRVVLQHVPTHRERLSKAIREGVDWMQSRARQELQDFFEPDRDGAVPIAYLWARTILSEAPESDGKPVVEVPLIKTMWLAKKAGAKKALRWVRDKRGVVHTDIVEMTYADGSTRRVRRPRLEVFDPSRDSEVEAGTVRKNSATCPVTGFTTAADRVRSQLKTRRGGTADARLYCVVLTREGEVGRTYRLPAQRDWEQASAAAAALKVLCRKDPTAPPAEETPRGGGRGAGRAFGQRSFGMERYSDLFTPRQLLALITYARLARDYVSAIQKEDASLGEAVSSCLGLLIDRLADLNCSLCAWQLSTPNTAHVFVRWAIQIVMDFGEINPLAAAGGSPESAIRRMLGIIDYLCASDPASGQVAQSSATEHPLPDDTAQAFVTDPPYYDAVPYADLMDFFSVWLKRATFPGLLSLDDPKVKDDECIVDEVKGKDRKYFEETMARCLAEGRRVLQPSGVGVIVFAHKSTAGWESLLKAVVDAGWIITASWPIDTEMGSRLRANKSAVLASSVHLVCLPRENPDGSLRTDEIGDWREVLQELPRRIHEWMPRLAEEGVVGADAIFACLGPALEIFSRHSRVEKASGEVVDLKEYLEQVWAAVAKEALTMVFSGADTTGFEPDARLTAMWLWTLNAGRHGSAEKTDEPEEVGEETKKAKVSGFVLEYDAARKIAQGLGAHLETLDHVVEISGETARLLPVSERARYLFGKDEGKMPTRRRKQAQLDLFKVLDEAEEHSAVVGAEISRAGDTVLDRIHQAMILFAAGRAEAVKRFLVEDGFGRDQRFWRLAQALSALYPTTTDEKRWVDGVLARKKGLGL